MVDEGGTPPVLLDALRARWHVDLVNSQRKAQDEVNSGKAAFYVTGVLPGEQTPNAGQGLYAEPVGLFVPFTFRLENVSLHEAEGILNGSIEDWSEVGGPEEAVDRLSLGRSAYVKPEALFDGGAPAGAVAVWPWDGPHLRAKALQVDSNLPDADGYALVETWVAVGAAEGVGGDLNVQAPAPDYVTLAATGDIMLDRTVGDDIQAHGSDYPFALAGDLLKADAVFGNLECVVSAQGEPAPKGFTFRAPLDSLDGLANAGFTAVSQANNHAMDYGPDALLDTLAGLDQRGVEHAGAGRDSDAAAAPAILDIRGLRVALLAYGAFYDETNFGRAQEEATASRPGIAYGDVERVAAGVAAAKEQADIVVVSLHSGNEYQDVLSDAQVSVARAAIDAGAALVLGSGPHVLQGIEYYGSGVIAYSMGNFVFDFDEQDRAVPGMPSALSGVLVVALDRSGVRGLEFRPAIIEKNRPEPARGDDAERVYDRLYSLTDALAG